MPLPPRGAPRPRRDAGQSTLEYVGAFGLAAVLIITLAVAAYSWNFATIAAQSACRVAEAAGGSCPPLPQQPAPPGSGDAPDRPWYCTFLPFLCPSAQQPDVDIPDGLDPDSALVQQLLSTERGRQTLQWLADNHIPIVIDPDTTGAYWDGSTMVIGEGYDDPAVIVHETNHAKYTHDGRHADAHRMSRDDYVAAAVDEEVDGTVQQIKAAKEFRDQGYEVHSPGEDAYDTAYQKAKDDGATDAEADRAGYDAVSDLFYSGAIVTSTTHQPYPDYYGDYWDSVH